MYMQGLTFKGIEPSTKKGKKFDAYFTYTLDGKKREKVVSFGAAGYMDYTTHKDPQRKDSYRSRHQKDNINDPLSPGALSWYILWNKPSLKESIKDYRNKFNI
jgi:hypothetical protein